MADIQGKIINAPAGVQVELVPATGGPQSGPIAADGSYVFTSVPAGVYTLKLSGGLILEANIDFDATATLTRDFSLTPAQEIELESQMQQMERMKGEAKAKAQAKFKEDLASVQKALEESPQLVTQYTQAYDLLVSAGQALRTYHDDKLKMIKTKITDTTALDAAIAIVQKKIDDALALKNQSNSDVLPQPATAEVKYKGAQESVKQHQDEHTELKTTQKRLEDKFKELKGLRELIEKEEEKQRYEIMYFYTTEIDRELKKATNKVPKPDDLEDGLSNALSALLAAYKAQAVELEEWELKKAIAAQAPKDYDTLFKNRNSDMLKAIEAAS